MNAVDLEVLYAQLAVFQADITQPFNNWTDTHVAQGFSWRPGSVSFRTLDEAGEVHVEVIHPLEEVQMSSSAVRIISVPFSVSDCGQIEIATITRSQLISIEPGEYELTFEHGRNPDGKMWARFCFSRALERVEPRIIRADSDLQPALNLLMFAEPA